MQLIKSNLSNILKTFDCKVQKGVFPYNFMNSDNLFYIGNKPEKKYYENISLKNYNEIPNNNWNVKDETLRYLKSDIEGLLEILLKFSKNIFENYSLNISNYPTLPSLSLSIYTSSFYNESNKIKMIKGQVEKDIRKSYFGGNVDVYINEVKNAYIYDMNSQYPNAMLQEMPIGNPIFTTEKNIDNIFGFVYGKITAPSEEILRVPFIQYKDSYIGNVTCPRGEFSRMIFTEEMKYARKYGYSIDIEYGYHFEKGTGLFDDFVNKHYLIKKESTDPVLRQIAKLMLNALYGKFGMKELNSKLKIISVKEANKITKNYNYSVFAKLNNDKVLIKYSSRINENLRKLFKTQEDRLSEKAESVKSIFLSDTGLGKKRGVPSAVHIASAIAAYSRISINEFKNIPGNPCIMSDTDSVVLPKKLNEQFVGKEIGQMKLEHIIKHGIFIRKKLYAIITDQNKEVIKASGAKSKFLSFDNFITLLNGNNVVSERLSFNVIWKELKINIVKTPIILKGLNHQPLTLFNTTDTNFKFISIPKSYPLIIYSKNILNLSRRTLSLKGQTSEAYLSAQIMENKPQQELDRLDDTNIFKEP